MQSFIVDSLRIEPKSRVTAWSIAVDGEIVRVTPALEYRLIRDGLKVVVSEGAKADFSPRSE
jgi:hypothetical protein